MANQKLTATTAAAFVLPDAVTPVVESGETKKVSFRNIVRSIQNLASLTGATPEELVIIATTFGEGRKLTWEEWAIIARRGLAAGFQIGMWQPTMNAALGQWSQLVGHSTSASSTTYVIAGAGDPNKLVIFNGYWEGYSSIVQSEYLPALLRGRFKNTGGVADTDRQFGWVGAVASAMDSAEPAQHYARFRLFTNTSGDTEWMAQCNNGTAGSAIASTGLSGADTDWHNWEIRLSPIAEVVRFYIDGSLVATLNTKYPKSPLGVLLYCKVFAGAGQNVELASIWTVARSWERV